MIAALNRQWSTLMASTTAKALGYALATAVGALIGYIYWQQVGCSSGSCAITSNPVNSSVYGAMMGLLAFNILTPQQNKTPNGKA
jgi:hypothetical protein